MMPLNWRQLLSLVLITCSISFSDQTQAQADTTFSEALHLQKLGTDLTVAHAVFQATASSSSPNSATFPKSILDIVATHHLARTTLTLTRGHWTWDAPLYRHTPSPAGLEFWLQFNDDQKQHKNEAFLAATQALGGLTATALATAPHIGVVAVPRTTWNHDGMQDDNTIYAALPQESVGASNVVNFLRLLSCRNQAGIAAYISPRNFLEARYHSLRLHIDNTKNGVVSLELRFTWTIDTNFAENLENTPRQSQESGSLQAVLKSFLNLKGQEAAPRQCLRAVESDVFIYTSNIDAAAAGISNNNKLIASSCRLFPSTDEEQQNGSSRGQVCGIYSDNPSPRATFLLSEESNKRGIVSLEATSVLKHTAGGQFSSLKIFTHVQHIPKLTSKPPIGFHIIQPLPWEVDPIWHTLRIRVDDIEIRLDHPDVIWHLFRPAIPRQSGSLIELMLRLPLSSASLPKESTQQQLGEDKTIRVEVSIQVKKRMLTIFDYPPDASRGVDIPSAHVTIFPMDGCETVLCGVRHARTPVNLVNLPIPDASMPFNVVCFTSTALAMLFGATMAPALAPPEEFLKPKSSFKTGLKKRIRRLVATVVLVGGLAIYLDPSLARQAEHFVSTTAERLLA